jgi:hypothetical protein
VLRPALHEVDQCLDVKLGAGKDGISAASCLDHGCFPCPDLTLALLRAPT